MADNKKTPPEQNKGKEDGESKSNPNMGNNVRKKTSLRPFASSVAFAPDVLSPKPEQNHGSISTTPPKVPGRGGGTPVASPTPSFTSSSPPVLAPSQTNIKGNQNRHRLSGLFSRDDSSIDVSVTASDIFRPGLISQVGAFKRGSATAVRGGEASGGGGDKDKRHPMSLAGSSIGSSSFGSGSELLALEAHQKKNRYKPLRRRWRRFRRKFRGCIYALISSFTSSLASYFVHHLTNEDKEGGVSFTPSYCLLWRYFGVLFPGIFIVLYYRWWCKEKIFDTVWPLQEPGALKRFGLSVVRAVLDVAAVFLNYEAFKYLLQSETSTILNSKPIIVQLLAHFTLGEQWGVVPIIISFVAAAGVVVMSKPPFLLPDGSKNAKNNDRDFTERLPGIAVATGSMLLASIVYCVLRYLKDVHYSVFSLFIGSTGVVVALSLVFGLEDFKVPTEYKDIAYLIAVAVLVCCSSISIVLALQNEEAFVVSLVRSLDVIFSFVWEVFLDHNYPDWYRGGGACIIMFCVIVIFFRKYLTHQDQDSKIYKAFAFLTK